MQSLLLIRPAPDKRALRRSLRGKPPSILIGEEETGTRVYPVFLPIAEDMRVRLTRRAWRRIEELARERGVLFGIAPAIDRRTIANGVFARGINLLDAEGVRQYLTITAMDRLFHILGRETAAEIRASVEDADTRWGELWVSFLSGWVRCLTVSGRGELIERLQQETLSRDGTVLAVGRRSPADIRIVLSAESLTGHEGIVVDGRPAFGGFLPGSLYCGWPDVPEPGGGDILSPWERSLAGVYHVLGHRFFSACAPPRDSRSRPDIMGLLKKTGVQIKGFLTDTTVVSFDRMRYQFFEKWSKSMSDRKKRRLDNCGDHDL